jgi:iron complex transport system substrate-binding protein
VKRIYCFLIIFFALGIAPVFSSEKPPQRIISLAPSLTREIYDLEAGNLLVGVTAYCPDAKSKEIVGTLSDLNIEKIIALKPDMVLAHKGCNKKKDIDTLRSLGFRVKIFEEGSSFEEICAVFLKLGKLLGKEQKAKTIVDHTSGQIAMLRDKIKHKQGKRIFWQISDKPLVTINDKTFASEFIRLSGSTNIFGELKARYPRVNIEEVIAKNPGVIIIVSDMGKTNASQNSIWKNMSTIDAVKNNRVYIIDPDKICQPTPLMFLEGYKTVISLLYPGVL